MGGGERHLADLANALAERGHDLYAALVPQSPLCEELAGLPEQNIVTLRLRNALDVKSAVKLAHFVRNRQIEIVHAHIARDYPLAALAARRGGAQLIITRHLLFPLNRLHALTLSRAGRVIAVSQSVARRLQSQRLFSADKISIVPNGIDLKRFDTATHNYSREEFCQQKRIAPEHFLIGTVGEINQLKGQEEFLRAAAIVARRLAEVDFIIAGADASRTGEHLAALERLIAELDLIARVRLTGWLDDVAPLLGSLDLFVSASHTESFGLSIAEAMASGLAVVATATEGAREMIEDGVTGVLVPVGDAGALAKAIIALREDVEARARIGARSRVAAHERFSLDRMVDEIERIYYETMNAER